MTLQAETIYQAMTKAGLHIENHASDLYTPATKEAIAICFRFACKFEFFKDQSGKRWIDIPFAYDPHWQGNPSVWMPDMGL